MTDQSTILITGASSGIGLATTKLLLAQGYRVIGLSRRDISNDLNHENYHSMSIDLSKLDQLESGLQKLLKTESIDCLVHSAGQGHFGSIEQFSVQQIEASLRLNLGSAMVLCRSLLPPMRQRRRGQIVFIGSESALNAGNKGALYSAAKFGLRGFSQALRADCASEGIRVSLINPGMVRSPFFEGLSFAPGSNAENAIEVDDIADTIWQILKSSSSIVIDEVNLTPRIKSIDFNKKK
jgi:3-hydroxy acid dehydrogenase/malonic semialdehyde reductase